MDLYNKRIVDLTYADWVFFDQALSVDGKRLSLVLNDGCVGFKVM